MHLVRVARNARDESRSAERVRFGVAERHYMGEQSAFKPVRYARRRVRREILRGYREHKPDKRQQPEQSAHFKSIDLVAAAYADVDYIFNDERHKQLQQSFEHFEKRRKKGLRPVFFDKR